MAGKSAFQHADPIQFLRRCSFFNTTKNVHINDVLVMTITVFGLWSQVCSRLELFQLVAADKQPGWYKQLCTVAAGVQQLWLFEFLAPTEMLTCDKFGAHATNHLRSVHSYQHITKAVNRRLKYII